jgi:hypothetical protein
MSPRSHRIRRLAIVVLALPLPAFAGEFQAGGMLSAWLNAGLGGGSRPVLGLRAVPQLSFSIPAGAKSAFDVDLAADATGHAEFSSAAPTAFDGEIKPYRAWVRFGAPRFELRAGLQKIDFGSATILRPLMWFDTLDPRDPLQITEGVYALLGRYYSLNNTNIWLWGMIGNTDPRGWDALSSDKTSPEFGGRIQVPVSTGELALSYHHRRISLSGLFPPGFTTPPPAPEDRIGLDGKWDAGVGLWFEGTLTRQRTADIPSPWRQALTLGADYTFGIGRGLTVIAEHFLLETSPTAFGTGQGARISAVLLRYSLGVLDEISGIFYRDWRNDGFYRFVNWQHTTDRWKFVLIAFWNPPDSQIYPGRDSGRLFTGKGVQLQMVYHF